MTTAKLIFEDGTSFDAQVFAHGKAVEAELVFNTAMLGYQEVLTDPSYKNQMVLMTYPMIGNYGIIAGEAESEEVQISALLVKEYSKHYSNWEATESLKSYLERHDVIGLEGLDTRKITNYLRKKGAVKARIELELDQPQEVSTTSFQLVQDEVSTKEVQHFGSVDAPLHIAILDSGIKHNIIRQLVDRDARVTLLPLHTTAKEILDQTFDGLLLSNGPGDPKDLENIAGEIRKLLGQLPIFGICMGHQLLGMALGAKIEKLRFGHHGINHPILHLERKQVEISSQNHNYVLTKSSLEAQNVEITHINLLDDSVAGIAAKDKLAFSVQYHPEAAPGPTDGYYLFDEFFELINEQALFSKELSWSLEECCS